MKAKIVPLIWAKVNTLRISSNHNTITLFEAFTLGLENPRRSKKTVRFIGETVEWRPFSSWPSAYKTTAVAEGEWWASWETSLKLAVPPTARPMERKPSETRWTSVPWASSFLSILQPSEKTTLPLQKLRQGFPTEGTHQHLSEVQIRRTHWRCSKEHCTERHIPWIVGFCTSINRYK